MPRAGGAGGEAQRRRQRRYRQRLVAQGRPEASAVDIAVAAAVAELVAEAAREAREEGSVPTTVRSVVKRLLLASVSRLQAAGYDRRWSTTEVRRRLSRIEFAPVGDVHPVSG